MAEYLRRGPENNPISELIRKQEEKIRRLAIDMAVDFAVSPRDRRRGIYAARSKVINPGDAKSEETGCSVPESWLSASLIYPLPYPDFKYDVYTSGEQLPVNRLYMSHTQREELWHWLFVEANRRSSMPASPAKMQDHMYGVMVRKILNPFLQGPGQRNEDEVQGTLEPMTPWEWPLGALAILKDHSNNDRPERWIAGWDALGSRFMGKVGGSYLPDGDKLYFVEYGMTDIPDPVKSFPFR
ncbi:hypothetical protein COY14_03830 [Candidatus Roizmanbacteria bacterium CG_4_10_14_0_2_um_filter_36_9]|uniref:Uncharacterized protein n=2 Tax=Candidatus Roizmaniibacteriota TaxID=1752723 RepID=A0A2M7U341_9BACT|nr:MAG: hypothetical protein COY14_03830 [Candidatus Roizmanbacteria bacterium CG_4_10_14_0_2_um_filter_36_9]